jgi:hypothetical protein
LVPPIFHKATLAPSEQSSGASSPPVEFTLEAETKTVIGCATYTLATVTLADAKGCIRCQGLHQRCAGGTGAAISPDIMEYLEQRRVP